MLRNFTQAGLCLLVAFVPTSWLVAEELPGQAQRILLRYCAECHAPGGKESLWLGREPDLSEPEIRLRVKAGSADLSALYQRMIDSENPMPPIEAKLNKIPPADLAIVKRWIDAGAAPISTESQSTRKTRGFDYVLSTVDAYLSKIPEDDQPYQRFFLLTNLHNQSKLRTKDLRTARAALSKTLNSLSWKPEFVIPKAIDADGLVLSIDLRDMGWEPNRSSSRPDVWRHIVAKYPYGLKHNDYPNQARSQEQWKRIEQSIGISIPWVRADWFITQTLQPPLYDELLYDLTLPEIASRKPSVELLLPDRKTRATLRPLNALDIEKRLGIDVRKNLLNFRDVQRIGFVKSFVSTGPRILERHLFGYSDSSASAYWKSYDFKKDPLVATVIQQAALGPPGVFDDVPENRVFKHDGGEIIFNLPNGLQAYLLVDSQGNRILFGPEDLVSDKNPALGSSQIVNGVSCITCHAQGMKQENVIDQVATGLTGLPAAIQTRVAKLYVDKTTMLASMSQDEKRFMNAMRNCTSMFTEPSDPVEPIKSVVSRFDSEPLDITDVAAELGIQPDELLERTRYNTEWDKAGLSTLVNQGTISRSAWESGKGLSMFKKAVIMLKVGSPASVE